MGKIGLVGGTFDPVHVGHLLLGQWAQEEFLLDEVWFLPAGNPYFKEGRKIASEEDRLAMTQLAVSENGSWRADDAEIGKGKNTYTYATVELLKKQYPQHKFYFIFGADCLNSLEHWRYPDRILENCSIIAAARGEESGTKEGIAQMQKKADALMKQFGGKIFVMNFPALEISSTMIRERIAAKKSIRYLVPEKVENYIREHGLYHPDTVLFTP